MSTSKMFLFEVDVQNKHTEQDRKKNSFAEKHTTFENSGVLLGE
jgi:hypothetical protein